MIDKRRSLAALRCFLAVVGMAVVLGQAHAARAEGPMGRTFGLGLALGNPTSLTGKYHLGAKEAVDFHLGAYHVYGKHRFHDSLFLGGDYLFEIWNFKENGAVSVPFYAGPGLGVVFDVDDDYGDADCYRDHKGKVHCDYRGDYDFGFGPRLPIGVGVEFQEAPFELLVELSPSMMIIFDDNGYDDDIDLDLDIPNFALIGRFYFD